MIQKASDSKFHTRTQTPHQGRPSDYTNTFQSHLSILLKGSRVITGGLDTLETIGRKTMEVLQDGDPGLERKKRAMMGFFDPDKPILSQV